MKKILVRSSIIAVLVTGIVAVLVWYFMMRREIPPHGRVIPKDAFAVLTLNLRELSIDRSGEEHLFSDKTDQALFHKELDPFINAVKTNGSSGINEKSDVLFFAYHSGEAAYLGLSVELEDSATFGNLMRIHVSRSFNITPWANEGFPLMRFDTTAAMIGWTEDAALFLYPISNHGIAHVSTQCIQLLKQKPENSVLADENFRENELTSFDASLWIHSESLLKFTEGGDLIVQSLSGIRYFNYFADFRDGEILVRSESETEPGATLEGRRETPFPCEPQDALAFIRFYLDSHADSLIETYVDTPPFNALPFSDEESAALFPYLDGNCTMILHDTITYPTTVISYEYDENFTRSEKTETVMHTANASTTTFRLKNAAEVRNLVSEWMERDSIPLTNRGWVYKESGLEARLIITDELMTVTTFPKADGRSHPIPPKLKNFMFSFDLAKLFRSKEFPIPYVNTEETFTLLEKHLLKLTCTMPVQIGNKSHSEICLKFSNTEINGLVQAEDLIRRIYTLDR